MGTTPSFNLVYGKNEKGKKVAIGVRTVDGKYYPGVRHPLDGKQAKEPKREKKPTIESTPPKRKGFGLRKKSKY